MKRKEQLNNTLPHSGCATPAQGFDMIPSPITVGLSRSITKNIQITNKRKDEMNDTRNELVLTDFYAAAALIATGVKMKSLVGELRTTKFIFESSEDNKKRLLQYYSHELKADVLDYAEQVKRLKGKIHDNRQKSNNH